MDKRTSQFKIKSNRGWVNSFALRHSDEVIPTKSGAQEGQRSQVPGAFLERRIQDLHKYVQGCVAELVFNLDEVGISDWEDRKAKKVIVAAALLGQTIHYGVSRNVKHISVIACLSAAGESLFHYIVTSHNSSTVQGHLKKHAVRFGRDFTLKFNQKAYFNAGIFLASVRTMLFPYIDIFPGRAVLALEIAVHLMAHYSAEVSDDVIRLLTEARVRVITFAPHATRLSAQKEGGTASAWACPVTRPGEE
jgi:hypothetical protein